MYQFSKKQKITLAVQSISFYPVLSLQSSRDQKDPFVPMF